MKPYVLYIFLALQLTGYLSLKAQDIHFSQMFETPVLRNPALAGIFSGDIRVQSVYRSQWNSVTNAYHTTSANFEYKLPVGDTHDFITLAAQALYDRAGTVDLSSTHILPALNYHKSLSQDRNMYLSLALMGGWVQRSIDQSKITTNSQFSGSSYNEFANNGETFPKSSYSYFDGSVGMSFNSQIGDNEGNNIYLGLGYHHFNKAKNVNFYSSSNLEMVPKWVASAGVRMNTTDYNYFTIEGDYTTQGAYKEILGGVLFSMKLDSPDDPKYLIHAGTYIRLNDAFIPVVKVENKPIAIALSYDINMSGLKKVSTGKGGFELSVTYQKFLDRDNSVKNALRCPKF